MRRAIVLAVGLVILVAIPSLAQAANDLCVTLDTSCCDERVVAKDFGPPPGKGKCKAITGFMLPFFSIANGTACTSSNGQTMFVEWTSVHASSNGVAIWNAAIPLPIPSIGTGNVLGLQEGVLPGGTTNAPFSAEKCEVAVPN